MEKKSLFAYAFCILFRTEKKKMQVLFPRYVCSIGGQFFLMGNLNLRQRTHLCSRVAIINAKNHTRQRRKRQSVTAKREKSQTPKVLTAKLTLPQPNLT